MKSIQLLREKASFGIITLLWINALLVAVAAAFGLGGILAPVAATVIAGSATASWAVDRTSPTTRIVTSMAHAASVAVIVYSFASTSLQIDMHMYFFASLAICAVWIDWRAIAAYASFVALHHTALYLAMPLAVFPGASDFSRVILHAVILIVQSGVLIALTHSVTTAFQESEDAIGRAVAAQRETLEMSEKAKAADHLARQQRLAHESERAREAEAVGKAVSRLESALHELSGGNLTSRITEAFDGRLDQLRISYNISIEKLGTVLHHLSEATGTIRNGSSQISDAAQDLSNRTEEQAASIEESVAALLEITATVKSTERTAEDVGRRVNAASAGADRSSGIVTSAVQAMSRIEASSRQINQIISVIDEIAFQTNLLALNAGVEAARAGEAGKGFAVVAQEVRELAQRSANAAKEIKTLIGASENHVRDGVTLVSQTGEALHAIAQEVAKISSEVSTIVRGAREQSTSLSEITSAIGAIDRNTQRNAAMVEETSAAALSLANEATALERLLAGFQLEGTTGWRAAA